MTEATSGKALRATVPRASHANWSPPDDRPSPVDVIVGQNAGRLEWLTPVRHWRMARSPFAFYRGAAKLMATDLAVTPTTGIEVQICGDAHLSNFGFYGSPERSLVFDVNDFDETLPGPWEWDIKRLAASFSIAARDRGMDGGAQTELARGAVAAYRDAMREIAKSPYLDLWYARISDRDVRDAFEGSVPKKVVKRYQKATRKMRGRGTQSAVAKLTKLTDDGLRINSNPPNIVPLRDLEDRAARDALISGLREAWDAYRASVPDNLQVLLDRYRFVDFAIKVVGVGSVGTRCYILLLEGRDENDLLFLQVKEAAASVLEDHLPASRYPSPGQRVVEGQRLMQTVSDIFIGWTVADSSGRHYYWRQLRDMKGSVDYALMAEEAFRRYADLCGWALAKAHARSADAASIAGYLGRSGEFDGAVAKFAMVYADQNETDFDEFTAAIKRGDIPAHE